MACRLIKHGHQIQPSWYDECFLQKNTGRKCVRIYRVRVYSWRMVLSSFFFKTQTAINWSGAGVFLLYLIRGLRIQLMDMSLEILFVRCGRSMRNCNNIRFLIWSINQPVYIRLSMCAWMGTGAYRSAMRSNIPVAIGNTQNITTLVASNNTSINGQT